MQTEKNIWLRALSMILTLALLISCIPNQVYAMAGEALAELMEQEETAETIETPNKTKRGVYEVTERREANVKHFALEDGTYTAVMYGSAVHTQDAEGNWQDIDNRLSASGSEFSTSNARIKFAKKITGNENLFTLHDGNRKITMSLNNAIKKTAGAVTNRTTEFDSEATQLQKLMTLDNLSSEILYADILDGVDLQYVVESLNVKENIIVKQQKDSYQYTFTIALNNLEAEMAEDGSVRIYDPDTKETVYNIPAGFMYDANGEYSAAVVYTLTNGGNGKYSLTVTADAAWINAEERAFPVVIDPTISTGGGNSYDYTSIHSWMSDEGGNTLNYLAAGTYGTAYWRINTLPALPAGAYITNASLTASRYTVSAYPNSSNTLELAVHKVISEWDPDTFCYSDFYAGTAGQYEEYAVDAINGENASCKYVWNITEIVREWYNVPSSNLGVAIKCTNKNGGDLLYRFTCGTVGQPLCIKYKVIRGVEDYWSYATQSAGRAGTGYVNKATGELTFAIGTLSTIDALFGQTVSLVYNQAFHGNYVDSGFDNIPLVNKNAGYGFKLNVNEYLVSKKYTDANGSEITYYVWTDADGTEHDFYPAEDNPATYKDDDGLLLTLTINEDEYTIEDMGHNVRTFNRSSLTNIHETGAVLKSIEDKDGNKLNYVYFSDGEEMEIQVIPNGSSTITYLVLEYNDYGLLEEIYTYGFPNASRVKFYYSPEYYATSNVSPQNQGYLKNIEFINDNQVIASSSYAYDSNGRLVGARDDTAGYYVLYTYSGNRISSVTEHSETDSEEGQTISITYADKYTEIRSCGSDDQYGTSDDIINAYVFDDYARLVSCHSMDLARTIIYGGTSGEYETQDNIKNNIKTSTTLGGAASNYIFNGGFEYVDDTGNAALGWKMPADGGISVGLTDPSDGNHAFFWINSNTTDTLSQKVHLVAGEYTLSATIDLADADDMQVRIKAKSLSNPSREFVKEIPANLLSTTDSASTYILNFEAENATAQGGEYFEIIFELVCDSKKTNSRLGIDHVMLERNNTHNAYSMVEFGNFDNYHTATGGSAAYTLNQYWSISNASVTNIDGLYGNVLKIDQTANNQGTAAQTIYRADPSDIASFDETKSYTGQEKKFIVAGMAKGTYQYASGVFQIEVYVEYMSGSDTFYVDFYNGTDEWQFASKLITTDDTKPVKSIELVLVYKNNPGIAYFDNIYATQILDNGTVFKDYYADGRLQKQENDHYWEAYEYDDRGNMTLLENSRGELYEYRYNDKDQLYQELYSIVYPEDNSSGLLKDTLRSSEYGYNTAGQMTSVITYQGGIPAVGAKNVVHVTSSYTYDIEAGSRTYGVLLEEVDNLGQTTKYFYDPTYGRLLAVVNVESGHGTCYSYDLLGNITSVMQANYTVSEGHQPVSNGASVAYSYNSANLLEKISTHYTSYRFTYNSFGKTESVSIGSNQIVSYDYNDSNGKLSAIHYGNGFTVQYIYDALDNISKVCYIENGITTDAYQYYYDAYGLLFRFENLLSGIGIRYQYDSSHRMIGYSEYDLNELTQDFSASILYNDQSQIAQAIYRYEYIQNHSVGTYSGFLEYNFGYNEDGTLNNCEIVTEETSGTINYYYDDLHRLSYKYCEFTDSVSNRSFSQSFLYNFTEPGYYKTSAQIESLVTQINSGAFYTYNFAYDDDGNITKITTEDFEIRYCYDALGQLIREDNTALNSTFVYIIDEVGDIINKKIYPLTAENETPIDCEKTHFYAYSISEWGDLLTGYDGIYFTHDAIGNPLDYYNGTSWDFTWEHGRRLATASGNGYSLAFTYNDEGIRTTKTVNGVEHRYVLNGDQIISEAWGEHLVLYLYDADGSSIGFQYHNDSYGFRRYDVYLFEKNLQGDIVAVYAENGTKLISYVYDAWGNFTTTYHNGGNSTSAVYNPFLYRGYYYDAELEMYYLQSRYYDPAIGRFLTADKFSTLNASPDSTTDKNLFAYCDNNPVMRKDDGGMFWDTVFDVVSLVFSVAEVVATPTNPGSWIGLAGDVVDLIPFVSGVGEIVRFARIADNTLEVVDTLHDTAKAVDRASETIESGWKVGDDITKLTKTGDTPSWSTVRSRYWKNEAHYNKSAYSKTNLNRMMQGKAPQFDYNGRVVSAELHHIVPRHKGGSNAYSNLLPVLPSEHAAIDAFRHFR